MSDTRLWDHHQNENRISLEEGHYRQDFIKREVLKKTPISGKILEIGFGDGYLIGELSKLGYKMIGQDLSERNIERTKKDWPDAKAEYLLGDESGKLLVEDNSLDGFIASEVCEHMTDEELVIVVNEIKRTLKSESYAFITFPYHENLERSMHFCPNCETRFHTWGHKQSWDTKHITTVFTGFSKIKIRRFISLGSTHHKNPLIRMAAKILDYTFLINQDIFSFIPSNYIVILQK